MPCLDAFLLSTFGTFISKVMPLSFCFDFVGRFLRLHVHKTFISSDEAVAALENGKKQLEMLHRQAVISQLYAPTVKSVMES
jgi:hypothetical protein